MEIFHVQSTPELRLFVGLFKTLNQHWRLFHFHHFLVFFLKAQTDNQL